MNHYRNTCTFQQIQRRSTVGIQTLFAGSTGITSESPVFELKNAITFVDKPFGDDRTISQVLAIAVQQ